MEWSELFPDGCEPSGCEIEAFVATPLWGDMAQYLQQTYAVKPVLFYSRCSMQNGMWKGWNIKYKKGGKALCTLYPKRGYFLPLVPVGLREMNEAELLMPGCTPYTQNLFAQTACGHTGKSLAFEVREESVLRDIKELVALRAAMR